MSMGWLVRLCVGLCALGGASLGHGAPQVFLHPVELMGYEGSDLRVKIEVPCGGVFFGLIAREGRENALELAAAVQQDAIVCTGVPEPLSLRVGFLDVHRFSSISSLATGAPKKLDIRPLASLHLGSVGTQGATLIASSRGGCGQILGAVLRPSGSGLLYVGLADLARRSGAADRGCSPSIKQSKIRVVALGALKHLRPLQSAARSLMRQYELRLAPVDMALLKEPVGALQLRYFRACQEAPIGIVTRRQRARAGRPATVQVGVLVARYFNAPCHGERQGEWTSMEGGDLALDKGTSLVGIPPLRPDESLVFQTPVAIERGPGDDLRSVKVAHTVECTTEAHYLIHTRTRRDQAAVGILTRTQERSILAPSRFPGRCTEEPQLAWMETERPSAETVYPLVLPR